jgi:hypothetical protein
MTSSKPATQPNRKAKRLAIGFLLIALAGIAYWLWDRHATASMISVTREWGRLAEFPKSATEFSIHTEGSMFTRAFRAEFVAPAPDLAPWIAASPGFSDAKVEQLGPHVKRYIIKPGGGAQWAQVEVNQSTGRVKIYVYWS